MSDLKTVVCALLPYDWLPVPWMLTAERRIDIGLIQHTKKEPSHCPPKLFTNFRDFYSGFGFSRKILVYFIEMELEKMICIQYPHLFKPMQSVNAVILLIFLGSTTAVDGSGVLWFVTMVSLFVSTVATVIFMLDKNDPLIMSMSNGILSWNIVEFIYSSILSILCGISFWLAFGYSSHVPPEGHSAGYVFAGIFLIIQTVFYAIPAILVYDRMRASEEEARVMHPFAKEPDNESGYQSQQIV